MVRWGYQHIPSGYPFSVVRMAGMEPVLADDIREDASVGADMEGDKKCRRNVWRQLREQVVYGLDAARGGADHDHGKVI